jgi:hypothetical protein
MCILLLGVVDQVHGRSVVVELSASNGEIANMDMPLWLFPCKIKEGDAFYVEKIDGVIEIQCGEPPIKGK